MKPNTYRAVMCAAIIMKSNIAKMASALAVAFLAWTRHYRKVSRLSSSRSYVIWEDRLMCKFSAKVAVTAVSVVAVFTLTGLLAASPSWAAPPACKDRDLPGEYQAYITELTITDPTTNATGHWSRCVLVIGNDGVIAPGIDACEEDDGTLSDIDGGSFSLTSECLVTGELESPLGTAVIDHAWFNRSKDIITGVGSNGSSADFFTFTMVKKR